MDFRIADTFTDALARLPAQEQKAVKTSAFDLQLDPSGPGLQFHRIQRSKDPNFWSMRVSRDLRIIVHKTAASLLLAYVDHHDRAYAWAERRRIEAHPSTGAVQIVEVRERVEEAAAAPPVAPIPAPTAEPGRARPQPAPPLFASLSREDLLAVGVPPDWLDDVAGSSEDGFLELATHLPAEAAEALLEYAASGSLVKPAPVPAVDGFSHPDALRRFRTVENLEELQQALDAPWEKWAVFLHPSQSAVVQRDYAGPARVAGSAGTGKTVVALHRAVRLAQGPDPTKRVLLTTFSRPLATALERKLKILAGPQTGVVPRITVAPLREFAAELHQLAFGTRPRVATGEQTRSALMKAAEEQGVTSFSPRFMVSEWIHVVDAWQLAGAEDYAAVPRLGRKSRIGAKQRDRLWPVFEAARRILAGRGLITWPQLFHAITDEVRRRRDKPFAHIVMDEAQDLSIPELRSLRRSRPTPRTHRSSPETSDSASSSSPSRGRGSGLT